MIEPGDLVVVNSGFLVEGHMSDVNRMAYVFREDEQLAPPLIQKLFDTGLASTRAGVAAIRPGATGEQVDAAARSVVVDAGFDEYGHATGHTTGVWVHGLGVIIGPRWKAYGEKVAMPMHEGDVYAIEPSLHAYSEAHGGTIRIHFQEMVIVDGGRGTISHRAGDRADVDSVDVKKQNAPQKRGVERNFPAATYSPTPQGCSTIGPEGLSCRVRNGIGRFPLGITTGKKLQPKPLSRQEPLRKKTQ